MSRYLLWWSHDGTPPPSPTPGQFAVALARWSPDGVRSATVPEAVAWHGHFDSSGGAETGLPIVDEDWLLTGSVRLDDRTSLRARLRDAGAPAVDAANDAHLLLAALHAWGEAAADRLRGDFAFVALDRKRHRVVAARSAFGVRPLVAVRQGAGNVVASDVAAIIAFLGVSPPVEASSVNEFLREGLLLRPSATYRRGVERLPGGHSWCWDRVGQRSERRTWTFPTPPILRRIADREAIEGFHEALGRAVSDRVREARVGLFLSGGLDSTALAATARRVRPGAEIAALTVAADPVIAHDEAQWATQAAEALGMPLHVMRDERDTALEHLEDRSIETDEPVDEPELLSLRAQVAWLGARARATLYGEDGDALLAAPPLHVIVRSLGLRHTVSAWASYRRTSGGRPWVGLRELGPVRRWIAARATPVPAWLHATTPPRSDGGEEPPEHSTHPNAVRAFGRPTWEAFMGSLAPDVVGQAHDFTFPLLDERVIAHVFSLPAIPWCQRKYLLRASFRGALPAELLERPKAALRGYDEALVARWRARGGANAPLPAAVDEWVDVTRWRETLHTGTTDEVRVAWRVLELSRWLAQGSSR